MWTARHNTLQPASALLPAAGETAAGGAAAAIFAVAAMGVWAALCSGCGGKVFGYDADARLGPDRDGSVDGATDGAVDDDGHVDGGRPDARPECPDEGTLVYVVSHDNELFRFDPPAKTFELVSVLDCPGPGRPFSMAVSRDATAYVLYYDPAATFQCVGLNKVSVITGECMGPTGFDCHNAAGFDLFGMGYATDGPDTEAETLYISNGWYGNPNLARINTGDWSVQWLAPLPTERLAEMTGNADGELWGFFGGETPKILARIDKQSGALDRQVTLSQLAGQQATAVAFWGGDFYVFWADSASGQVYRVRNGNVSVYTTYDFEIVGAGVSTCAPLNPPQPDAGVYP